MDVTVGLRKAERWRINAFEQSCWIRLLKFPWTARKSNQSILKEISPGISLQGMMLKLKETPVLWPPHAKSWLIWKDSDAGSDWGQEEKGTTEDEMAGWHHWLHRREFEWTLGVGDGQGGLVCCNSWGLKELDTAERMNWTDKQGEKTVFRMGENNSKRSNWQRISLKNMQAAHAAQYQKNKWLNQKMVQRTKQTFLQRRHTDG